MGRQIGCGTGLAGIAACALGAPLVTLTDKADCLSLARDNARLNAASLAGEVRVAPLAWGSASSDAIDAPADLLLASDCFYAPEEFEAVFLLIATVMTRQKERHGRRCVALISYQDRGYESSNYL